MIKLTFMEDRDIKKSLPSTLTQLFKHIINCIYQPKIYHRGWAESVRKQAMEIQNAINKNSYAKVERILMESANSCYAKALLLLYKDMKNSTVSNPYTIKEMQNLIPKNYIDLGKNTNFKDFTWNINALMSYEVIDKFLEKVENNSQAVY